MSLVDVRRRLLKLMKEVDMAVKDLDRVAERVEEQGLLFRADELRDIKEGLNDIRIELGRTADMLRHIERELSRGHEKG